MLKLNLLPPNIYEPRKKRVWFAVFVVVWLALAGGMIAWQLSLVNQRAQKQEELQAQEAIVRQVTQIEQEAQNTKRLVAPLLARVSLADEVFRYNKQYPKLYREVRRWTVDTVRYNSMGVAQGMTLQAQAVTRDLDEMARYLQVMLQCPLFTGVSISWSAAGTATTLTGSALGAPFGAYGGPGVPGAPVMPGGISAAGGVPGAPILPGGMSAPTGGLTARQMQQQAGGIVFTVVANLREPVVNQVQQWIAALGGTGATGFGLGAGIPGGLPGAPMMGAPGMGGPMMGPPPSMGGGMGAGPVPGGATSPGAGAPSGRGALAE